MFQILEERNISQAELAQATGISPGNISDWKAGRSKPSADRLRILSDYLGVSVDYLLGSDGAERAREPAGTNEAPRDERLARLIEGDPVLLRLAEALCRLSEQDLAQVEQFVDYLAQRQKK